MFNICFLKTLIFIGFLIQNLQPHVQKGIEQVKEREEMERIRGDKKNQEEIHQTSRSNFKTDYYWVFNVIIMTFVSYAFHFISFQYGSCCYLSVLLLFTTTPQCFPLCVFTSITCQLPLSLLWAQSVEIAMC